MIEFVEAVPLARILAEHRTITAFLNEHNPDESSALAYPRTSKNQLHQQEQDLLWLQ